jgi:uncharacterized membrane protein YidH (DUF202 family)
VRQSSGPRPAKAVGPNTLRDHLANERTFLAWIRTAIAIVALGFVVAKFGLVLREIGGTRVHPDTARAGAVVGVGLVGFGIVSAALASLKFMQTKRDIDCDVVNFRPELDIALAVLVGIASIVLAAYLIFTA